MKNQKKLLILPLLILSIIFSSVIAANTRAQVVYAASHHDETFLVLTSAINSFRGELNEDGGIRWFDESSSVAATIRVVLALAASGVSQDYLAGNNGNNPVDYLISDGTDWVFGDEEEPTINVARAGQLLTAVSAANQNPFAFGLEDINLVSMIKNQYDPNVGVFGGSSDQNVTDQVWALIGLASAYQSIPLEAVEWLTSVQAADGSWDDGFGSYLDMTPLAILALTAGGQSNLDTTSIELGLNFIKDNQQINGGWQTSWDTTINANTTGMILQAMSAAGVDPASQEWAQDESTAVDALLNLQQDNGAIGGDLTNAYSTADAILGLSGQPIFNLSRLSRIGRAFEYIFSAQESDGGWGSVGQTIDVILAARAAGWDPTTIKTGNNFPLDYLKDNLIPYLENGPDAIGKAILGLVTAGQDPRNFNSIDLVEKLIETYDKENHAFGSPENTWHQVFAVLGLFAADELIPTDVVQTIISLQQADGGWEYSVDFGSWPDNTAIAIQALLAAEIEPNSEAILNGIKFLTSFQLDDGGWGDASSTAYVLLTLNALGIENNSWITDFGTTPMDELFSFQLPSGGFMFSTEYPDENLMSSTSAALASVGGHFILAPDNKPSKNIAGLVIQPDYENAFASCVPIEKDHISGLALLDASGVPYKIKDGFIDSILDVSNPQGGTNYWSYWSWNGREWEFSNVGVNESKVFPGSIEALYFTSWEIFPSPAPEVFPNINSVCGLNFLKNYQVQPYLHFYDIEQELRHETSLVALQVNYDKQIESSQKDINDSPQTERTEELLPTIEGVAQEQKSLSLIPIIIIGLVGLGVVVFLIVSFKRKNNA